VIRIEAAAPESVAWEHSLLKFLGDRVEEVVVPIPAADGSTFVVDRRRVLSAWPYVERTPARRRSERHAVAAAELLARLHRAGLEWRGGQRPGARPVGGEGQRGPIHGDFYRGNVLVRRGRIVGLIDWEESCVDRFDYDLANAVWEFCKDMRRHDFDRRLARAMLEAYDGPAGGDDLLDLIRVRRRREIADSLEREALGEAVDVAYRRHNERALANLGG
jgi:Ser/Thr protein kinase RdoA (MazF antagonist)